jgi:Protoporphyrinogen oxidase
MKQVHIIGAGFAGLTLALRLAEKGADVHLYEKSNRVGGLLGTAQTEYGPAEQAANALLANEASVRLFNELGIEPLFPLKESRKRFIWRGKPTTWPLKFSETLRLITGIFSKILFDKKALKPLPTQTLRHWGEKHLGKGAVDYLLEPAMQGIYAAESKSLSSSLILGPMFQAKKKKKSYKGMLTGPQGMQDLVDKLEERCRDKGVKIFLNSEISLEALKGQTVIIATSMRAASDIVAPRSKELSHLLSTLPTTSLLSAKLFFKESQEKYKGFGVLIPRKEGYKSLGVLFNSFIFAGRNKSYNETWILTGSHDLFQSVDSEILKLIAEERFKLLGLKDALLDYRLDRWENALPLYGIELEQALQNISSLEKAAELRLHGNYLGGIGLSKILERSEALAKEILS